MGQLEEKQQMKYSDLDSHVQLCSPVYNALIDELEMHDVSNLQTIESEVLEPLPGSGAESLRYYARDIDAHCEPYHTRFR